jgi:cbb3-type cytochrome oxidase cytochrome c subunit
MAPPKLEPGRDPEMARRTQRLNLVFAASSVGLLVALSMMVWADYDREWKRYQIEFGALEVEATEKQIEEALGKVGKQRLDALQASLEQGRREAAERASEIGRIDEELRQLGGQWYAADQDFRFTKARIDVARYELDEAVHHRHGDPAGARAKLEGLEARWQELRLRVQEVESRQREAKARLDALQTTKLAAEAAEKETLGEVKRLQDRVRQIRPGVVSFLRNLPILDLANPSLKINQIMPANLYDDVVFSPTPKVDRCTTCHLGVDKKAYDGKDIPTVFRTHPNLELYLQGPHPMDKVGCTVCHQGRGRATGFQKAAHVPFSKDQEKEWGKYTRSPEYHPLHYWDLPMMARGHTESQCAKCHQGVVEVPRAERLNTGVFLIERYGCFGCHKIKGWEGLRKVGPDLAKVASKTNEDWILRWLQEPKAFRRTRMPQPWGVRTKDKQTPELQARDLAEMVAVAAYVVDRSAKDTYPEPPRGDPAAGRKLFESVGCLACHRNGDEKLDKLGISGIPAAGFRTHGPDLSGTGSKVSAGWLYAWIRDPKSYWHETKMPSLRLTEREAADITAHLMTLRRDDFMARPRPTADPQVRDAILRDYLVAQLPVKQAEEKLASMSDRERTLLLGEKTIGRAGCFGCHNIPGFEKTTPIGTELTEQGSKLVERLDFGFEHERLPHTLAAWLKEKMLEPRIFDRNKDKRHEELLRMPKFHFTEDEAEAVVTGLLSFTKEQVPAAAQRQLTADERFVEKGRRLVRDLNCQGCHQIGAQGGTIQEVVAQLLEDQGEDTLAAQALSPPLLYNEKAKVGEGSRVHTDWLHGFLKDPANRIRPWLDIRMPTFDLSEEQANTLTHYFASLDRVPYPYAPRPTVTADQVADGRRLFEGFQCAKCHVVAGRLPNQPKSNMAPDLALVPRRLRADWLTVWLTDPQRVQPGTRMPTNFPKEAKDNAFPEILGGDQQKQIAAVRAYLLSLGGGGGSAGR